MNSFPISAFFRLEKELSTFLTWLERCEALASSPEVDIAADRVKAESELQSVQARKRGETSSVCWGITRARTNPSLQLNFLLWFGDPKNNNPDRKDRVMVNVVMSTY